VTTTPRDKFSDQLPDHHDQHDLPIFLGHTTRSQTPRRELYTGHGGSVAVVHAAPVSYSLLQIPYVGDGNKAFVGAVETELRAH
jgi:hypothetical protein